MIGAGVDELDPKGFELSFELDFESEEPACEAEAVVGEYLARRTVALSGFVKARYCSLSGWVLAGDL